METVLYGDILFIINFSMDFLTLFVTGKILHLKTSIASMLLASSVGAVYAIASVMLEGAVIFSLMINVAVSFLMCYITFRTRILRCTALFYSTGLVLGGALTASFVLLSRIEGRSSYLANGGTVVLSGNIPLGWMAVITLITCAAAILSGRFASARKFASEVSIKVEDGGRSTVLRGMTDSGNLLKDPFEGMPVIVAGRDALLSFVPAELSSYFTSGDLRAADNLNISLVRKIRIIPATVASGERVLFMAFIPDSIEINGIQRRACIAADFRNESNRDFAGFDAIVPNVLL